MTLTVEDGSVVAGAESYVTVAQFKTYCDSLGISYADTTDAQIEQNARNAFFKYMLVRYRGFWKGYRKDATQVGDWPRAFVYLEPVMIGLVGSYPYLVPDDSIPFEVRNAQCELMVRVAALGDLLPDLGQKEQSVTVGPISVMYNPSSSADPKYGVVDGYLKPYLIGGGNSATSKVMRV